MSGELKVLPEGSSAAPQHDVGGEDTLFEPIAAAGTSADPRSRRLKSLSRLIRRFPGLFVAGAGLAIGLVGIPAFPGDADWVAWLVTAISAPVLVYESCLVAMHRRLERSIKTTEVAATGSLSQLADEAKRSVKANVDAFALVGEFRSQNLGVDDREVVRSVCLPISLQALALQRGQLLTTDYDLCITLREIIESALGEIAVFDLDERYEIPSTQAASIARIAKPIVVVTTRAMDADFIVASSRQGLAELMWPVTAAWREKLNADRIRLLHEVKWYSVDSYEVGQTTVDYRIIASPSPDQIAAAMGLTDRASLASLRAIGADLLGLAVPSSPSMLDRIVAAGSVRRRATYRVWVRNALHGDDPLYRYVRPFYRPTTVSRIAFKLDRQLRETWRLGPAVVNAAFPLRHPIRRRDFAEQDLSWESPDDSTAVPFLPGHGLTFFWDRRTNAQ